MAALVVVALILSMLGHSSATWCICKEGLGDGALQKTLDYACGAGADCTFIHSNGACYNPNTVRAHCNYAVNSFFQKKGQAQGTCDFSGTASVTASDPSTTGCIYPASASATGTTPVTTTPSTTTPSTTNTTPSTTTPMGSSPYITTPTGVLGPSGTGINTDVSHGGPTLCPASFFSFSTSLMVSGLLAFLWG
ncbi:PLASMODESMATA CALLOSE-BINDING PROTEIN 3-like [Actinidia eriantha]|uniref:PLASMODESMATA CALLOSE-BINDING PROTEIN 3-like n=1 Tax=Actinidia eriantha TaxID=165200 RepID=UPI00258CECB8|nr:PLASMODESMATA CALLOSE-BINDING PROTEIN 3-like [Actinidia eriantha]